MGYKPVDKLCPPKIADSLREKGIFTAKQLYKLFLRFSTDNFVKYLITPPIKGVTDKKAKKVHEWLCDWEKVNLRESQEICSEVENERQAEIPRQEVEDDPESSGNESEEEASDSKEEKPKNYSYRNGTELDYAIKKAQLRANF